MDGAQLRWDIAAAHEGKPAPLQQNRLSPQLLLRLLRGFHTHGHYPGEPPHTTTPVVPNAPRTSRPLFLRVAHSDSE
jgi:hypothetical protein